MSQSHIELIRLLYKEYAGCNFDNITQLPPSGSNRRYYRIYRGGKSLIGACNEDIKENTAFFYLSGFFKSQGLNVPEVYNIAKDKVTYLMEDLGDMTLLNFIEAEQDHKLQHGQAPRYVITDRIKEVYKAAIKGLIGFQISGKQGLDYSVCYPRAAFDARSMAWDMNYFKYYFLRFAGIVFDEQLLEDDFVSFSKYLLNAKTDYFLYRDFQSRNIMITESGQPFFIDYQGGRKGALHYDIASILFEARTSLPEEFREEMLYWYIKCLKEFMPVNEEEFIQYYYAYALIRTMQAMGAYGYRGIFERKQLFLDSIPPALSHMEWLLKKAIWPEGLSELRNVCEKLTGPNKLSELMQGNTPK